MNFTKQDLIELKHSQILTQNAKMKKTSKETGTRIFNFGITAYKSHSTGRITCPLADTCVNLCYASKRSYTWTNTKKAYERRYLLTKDKALFMQKMSDAIKNRKPTHLRIHDSGDFYNREYIKNWFSIMEQFPNVIFYAYTKSKLFFDTFKNIPTNFTLIYSIGSKRDELINLDKDRHAKIFKNEYDLLNEGYVNASENDLIAINKENKKIGLIFH
jgi:hypothetical protein